MIQSIKRLVSCSDPLEEIDEMLIRRRKARQQRFVERGVVNSDMKSDAKHLQSFIQTFDRLMAA